ncbi:hypothetical protein [Desulfovibrio ferrophilus]|uniref:Uncharacterized protein n=1 Tax=Desulfovibrio ferrophilus TaxID=241368 RepID=A0A2Z6AWB3_9BACT|nr:hypothetical protein [Desulfovibrio ferrophilus]BBD07532.1 putative uncharacterized protein [Desulfovibrio ferrophilus]
MSSQNVNGLTMVSEMSFGSKSMASQSVREYNETVRKNAEQYSNVITDLRDVKSPAEQATGKVFQALA